MDTLRRLDECVAKVGRATTVRFLGRVTDVVGVVIESEGPNASIGDVCLIRSQSGHSAQDAEVVGIRGHKVLLMALGELNGIGPGSVVLRKRQQFTTPVGAELLGRVIDGLGRPIDNKGPLRVRQRRSIYQPAPDPLSRRRVERPLATGIRAIDALLTCGEGQRMGIFSGSGVGKSVLLGMIARNTDADVNVIGLIGERGREVRDFLERDLGEQGLRRSVVVVVTGDQAALLRVKGALVATTIAEYFRDQGLRVMLMMDSITRVAMAQREIGLSVGEPPTTRGYTPSVFAFLPKLLERAGNTQCGSITGLYTVLVEGDDLNEPVSDAVRAILDGHVVLSRRLANVNHYPAIDVLASTSRVMIDVVSREHLEAARKVVEILSVYREAEDLINIGAYVPGSNRKVDYARSMIERVNAFLRQGIDERVDFARAVQELKALVG
ncbi:MAG: flagellar protein export ATPase FliI [candidate division KSB1 bacterium]|nr:flagellar protein export ATPase FliI [candidate division KSB1 bacterium]